MLFVVLQAYSNALVVREELPVHIGMALLPAGFRLFLSIVFREYSSLIFPVVDSWKSLSGLKCILELLQQRSVFLLIHFENEKQLNYL